MNKDLIKEIGSMYTCIHLLDINKIKADERIYERVKSISGGLLIKRWVQEKNPCIKEKIEVLIAKKLIGLNPILRYNDVPSIYEYYLDNVSSIDAIVELLNSSNENIKNIANNKYIMFFDEYLDNEDKNKVIEFRRII